MARSAQAGVKIYKERIRPLHQVADVYHLFPRPDGTAWSGIQYHDPASGKGVVYIFKPDKGTQQWKLRLRGLDPAANYRLEFIDQSHLEATVAGKKLLEDGLDLSLPSKDWTSELLFISTLR